MKAGHPVIAIIQARMRSRRLPGKVLKRAQGKSLLQLELERIARSKLIDKMVVATSAKKADDPIMHLAKRLDIAYFRGSEDDVLDRYYRAAEEFGASTIVRITGDCPLMDPAVVDRVVGFYLKNRKKYDYVSNVHPPTFPDGMDVEVCSLSALARAWKSARMASEREHVTAYIWKRPRLFRIGNVVNREDSSRFRLTVDEPRDLALVRQVFSRLYPRKALFTLDDIIRLLKNKPELLRINRNIERDEGYRMSLARDTFLKTKR